MIVYYPGKLNPDSAGQMEQALSGHFADWHPPIMAAIWRALGAVWPGPAPMLALDVGFYWLGVWCILDCCSGIRGWRAVAVVAAAFHPLFLVLLGFVLKDVAMASALVAGFGILFRQREFGRPITPFVGLAVALLLAYAALVRANGMFAVAPILFYWVATRPTSNVAMCLFRDHARRFGNSCGKSRQQ
jgi:hypothetical protein